MSNQSEENRREHKRRQKERKKRKQELERKQRELAKQKKSSNLSGNDQKSSNNRAAGNKADQKSQKDKYGRIRHKLPISPRLLGLVGVCAAIVVSMVGSFNLRSNFIAGWLAIVSLCGVEAVHFHNRFAEERAKPRAFVVTWITFALGFALLSLFAIFGYQWLSADPNLLTAGSEPMPVRHGHVPTNEELSKMTPDGARIVLADAGRPYDDTQIPSDAMRLYFGDCLLWTRTFPCFVFTQENEEMITLERGGKGDILFSARLFDQDGKIGCWIKDNVDRKIRPDRWTVDKSDHQIKVFNNETNMFADIEYLNPNAIRITGDFFLKSGFHAVVTKDSLKLSGDRATSKLYGTILNVERGTRVVWVDRPAKRPAAHCGSLIVQEYRSGNNLLVMAALHDTKDTRIRKTDRTCGSQWSVIAT